MYVRVMFDEHTCGDQCTYVRFIWQCAYISFVNYVRAVWMSGHVNWGVQRPSNIVIMCGTAYLPYFLPISMVFMGPKYVIYGP